MRLKVIIVIILILAVPTSMVGVASPSVQTTHSGGYDYNFTALKAGSMPSNNSWISFGLVNNSTSASIGIEKGHGMNGLQVSTLNYGSSSQFLNLSLNVTNPVTIQITFSWNYNNSFVSTGNNLQFGSNSNEYLNYQFGPAYNKELNLQGNKSSSLGPEPGSTAYYTLLYSWTGRSNLVYSNMEKGWNISSSIPYAIAPASAISGNRLDLLVGGSISNVTIYNIYMNSSIGNFITPVYNSTAKFKQEMVSTNLDNSSINSSGWVPVVDQKLNSLVFFSNKTTPGLYSFNYYNNTSIELMEINSGMGEISSSSNSSYAFFLLSNKVSSRLISINFNNLSENSINISFNFSSNSRILLFGDAIFLISGNGSVIKITGVGNQMRVVFSKTDDLGILVSASNNSSKEEVSFVNTTGTGVNNYILWENGSLSELGNYGIIPFDSNVSPTIGTSSNPSALLNIGNITGINETLSLGGNTTYPMIMNNGFSLIRSGGVYSLLSRDGYIYATLGGVVYPTNIKSNSAYAYISSNRSFALTVTDGVVNLYSSNTNFYSGYNISMNFTAPRILSGNMSLEYSVNSSIQYSVDASLGNETLKPHMGYLNFSSSFIKNGSYLFVLTAKNLAGYSTTISSEVSVDNFVPQIMLNPSNHSTVLENSTLTVNITGLSGSVVSYLEFSSISNSSFTGTSYNTTFPNYIGNVTLYLNITDEFGVVRQYSYTFDVQKINASGYYSNIRPNSYLSTGNLNISWSQVKFVKLYSITLFSNEIKIQNDTVANYTSVDLGNGSYNMQIEALLQNSTWISVVNENFTVQLFDPGLSLNYSQDHYFSFFGNSENNSLGIYAVTNTSVTFSLSITMDHASVFHYVSSGNLLNLKLNASYRFLRNNGDYKVKLTATEYSGRISLETFNFSVNNTIPSTTLPNQAIFTNRSEFSLQQNAGINSTTTYYVISETGERMRITNSSLSLHNITTKLYVIDKTKWGNTNHSNFTITYSAEKPDITGKIPSNILIWKNYILLSYQVKDPVNLIKLNVLVNNNTVYTTTAEQGTVNISFPSDGNYTIGILSLDVCGNQNFTILGSITSEYYPSIKNIDASIGMFMGVAHLSRKTSGTNLESVNYKWVVDGNPVSSENSVLIFLMPGEHNITLVASYHGNNIASVHHVFTFGFVPELIFLSGLAALFIYRRYSGSEDEEAAANLIMENLGKSRSEIKSIARKNRIRAQTFNDTVKVLSSDSRIKLMPDPDGVVYIMPPKERM